MRNFYRWMLGLFIMLTGLTTLVVGLGRWLRGSTVAAADMVATVAARTPTYVGLGIDTCAGRTCYLGITPEVTVFSEALQERLLQVGFQEGLNLYFTSMVTHTAFIKTTGFDGQSASAITITATDRQAFPDLAQAFQEFGPPCGVALHKYGGQLVSLLYPYFEIEVYWRGKHLEKSTRASRISIYGLPAGYTKQACFNHGPNDYQETFIKMPWQGFSTYQRYWALAQRIYQRR